MPTNGYVPQIIYIICSIIKISIDKKYKELKIKEIIVTVCALLNSDGGQVELRSEEEDEKKLSFELATSLIRVLEQSIISFIGAHQTVWHLKFEVIDGKRIQIQVKKSHFLITINYNLYLPSETQVIQMSSNDSLEMIKESITDREMFKDLVEVGSHQKMFVKNQSCGHWESKIAQFRLLKAVSSKRTTLADRMTGKSNKFICYVSAFANYKGGHIYNGIRGDGVVEGEVISNMEEMSDITKKVERAINKMIWPMEIGQPKRGMHWEIFFEPVLDENSNPIQSTFVIVIYIAPCLGGVFTEEPECYEMVEGRVEKMSFTTWKKKVLQPAGSSPEKEVPSAVKRVPSSSSKTKRLCIMTDAVLMHAINNAKWQLFSKLATHIEDNRCEVDVKLVVLSKRVMVSYRQGLFNKARSLLIDYCKYLPKAEEVLVFEVILLYLKAALERAAENFYEAKKILIEALSKSEQIEAGLVTTAVYSFAAVMYGNPINDTDPSPDVLAIEALEHLKGVNDSPVVRADMEQKAHVTLAIFNLGYSMSGEVIKENVNTFCLEIAKSNIMALNQSVLNGNPLSRYREIQFILAQSILYYRYSRVDPKNEEKFLEDAFNYSEKGEERAKGFGFKEMINWAQSTKALCTEALVLSKLRKMKNVKIYKAHMTKTSKL